MSDDDHLHSIIADYGDACAEMQAELDRLRADAVRRIEETDRVLVANGRLRAELAAKDKRFDDAVEAIDLKDKELIQERGVSRDLRKRVGELEGLFSRVGVETHKWFDPECGHGGCQSLVLKARAAELENKNSYNLQIVREATARIAELEELEADALQCASVEADLRREFRARAERAEAERDALHLFSGAQAAVIKEMREALELGRRRDRPLPEMRCDCCDNGIDDEWDFCPFCGHAHPDAAPSPAGREERHEMTSIGDKEPDADPAREPPPD